MNDGNVGVVATAHELIKDVQSMINQIGIFAGNGHTTHITAEEERSDIAGVFDIVFQIALIICLTLFVEHDFGLQVHSHTFHIVGKIGLVLIEFKRAVFGLRIPFQDVRVYHLLTVVAQEHPVGYHVGTDFQLHSRVSPCVIQRGTVAAYIDTAFDDGGMVGVCSFQTDRHLLGVGAVVVEVSYVFSKVQVSVFLVILLHIRVGIGTVAAAVDVALDGGIDADGIAAIHYASDVVTAIYIIYIASSHQHTSRQLVGEMIDELVIRVSVSEVCHRHDIAVHRRPHVGHTATAIDILNLKFVLDGLFLCIRQSGRHFGVDLQQQTLGAGHITLVAAAVEISDSAALQVPCRHDVHLGKVVAAEETTNLVFITLYEGEQVVDAHLL